MSIRGRLDRLEKRAPDTDVCTWIPPTVEVRPGDDKEALDARLAEMERQALAAGWRPGPDRFFVILAMLPGGDGGS